MIFKFIILLRTEKEEDEEGGGVTVGGVVEKGKKESRQRRFVQNQHGPSCGPGVMSCPILVPGQSGQDRVSGQKSQPDDYLGQDIGHILGPVTPVICAALVITIAAKFYNFLKK